MQNVYFTADTHYGHANIIRYCNRPYATIEEHDEALIVNHNSVVQKDSLVFHLGDFAFGKTKKEFDRVFDRLNGRICLVKGNHDHLAEVNAYRFHRFYDSYQEIELVYRQPITLCHYAMKVWNRSHHGSWHLYGHSHGTLPDDPNSRSFDVGVDCHKYRPISYKEVAAIMATKQFKPLDYHVGVKA